MAEQSTRPAVVRPAHLSRPRAESMPSRHILVVDDHKVIAEAIAVLLRRLGHEVDIAYDGQEALAAAETLRPDLILLDLELPRLNGYEVARRIRREPWGRQIVLAAQTGYGQVEYRTRSKEAGFDHHLIKPVSQETLRELIATLPSSVLST